MCPQKALASNEMRSYQVSQAHIVSCWVLADAKLPEKGGFWRIDEQIEMRQIQQWLGGAEHVNNC